jgi:D-alanyl-D-alanine carboxypeptidase
MLAATLAALQFVQSSAFAAQPTEQTTLARAIDKARSEAGFSGVVLVSDRDQLVHEQVVRATNNGNAAAYDTRSIWRWASVTKQVTALLVMQEVTLGRLSLDGTPAT